MAAIQSHVIRLGLDWCQYSVSGIGLYQRYRYGISIDDTEADTSADTANTWRLCNKSIHPLMTPYKQKTKQQHQRLGDKPAYSPTSQWHAGLLVTPSDKGATYGGICRQHQKQQPLCSFCIDAAHTPTMNRTLACQSLVCHSLIGQSVCSSTANDKFRTAGCIETTSGHFSVGVAG